MQKTNRTQPARGFVLITAAVSLAALLALTGLAVDVGHLYVVRAELQVFADEAAMSAAFELDGTAAGLNRARDTAASGPLAGGARNRWNFSTATVAGAAVQFATTSVGPFVTSPGSAAGMRYVRVRAASSVPLYFLPVVPGIGSAQAVSAVAVAGQVPAGSLGNGLAPFAPSAHNPLDPAFGFTVGQSYTLRWAPGGQRNKEGGSCPGDAGFDPGSASERGYMDVGQGSGASALRAAVVDNSYFLPAPLQIGDAVNMYSGQESVPDAVELRFRQDTDLSAATYGAYTGNGRRILVTAITDSADPPHVVGFGSFFLHPVPCGTKNTTPCCAEYIGAAVVSGRWKGAGGPGLYQVELAQ